MAEFNKIEAIQKHEYAEAEKLVEEAFLTEEHSDGEEHFLVQRLRKEEAYKPALEMVAKNEQGQLIGYGMLSEITIVSANKEILALALAPLAVASAYQGKGVGKSLIQMLEKKAEELGYLGISILGDPNYYGRFGYAPASNFNIKAPFDIPESYYLFKPFVSGLDFSGVIHYQHAFGIES